MESRRTPSATGSFAPQRCMWRPRSWRRTSQARLTLPSTRMHINNEPLDGASACIHASAEPAPRFPAWPERSAQLSGTGVAPPYMRRRQRLATTIRVAVAVQRHWPPTRVLDMRRCAGRHPQSRIDCMEGPPPGRMRKQQLTPRRALRETNMACIRFDVLYVPAHRRNNFLEHCNAIGPNLLTSGLDSKRMPLLSRVPPRGTSLGLCKLYTCRAPWISSTSRAAP